MKARIVKQLPIGFGSDPNLISSSTLGTSKFSPNELGGGIANLGTTCYISSSLQLILRSVRFSSFLRECNQNHPEISIIEILYSLYEQILNGRGSIDPSPLTQYLKVAVSVQEDICDFLTFLFEVISSELPEEERGEFDSIVMSSIKREGIPEEKMIFYTVPVDPEKDIQAYIINEMAKSGSEFSYIAPVFFIQIQRMQFHREDSQIHKDCRSMEVRPRINLRPVGGEELELVGMCCHSGTGFVGHYTSLVHDPKGWIHANDSRVCSITSVEQMESIYKGADSQAYLLMFVRDVKEMVCPRNKRQFRTFDMKNEHHKSDEEEDTIQYPPNVAFYNAEIIVHSKFIDASQMIQSDVKDVEFPTVDLLREYLHEMSLTKQIRIQIKDQVYYQKLPLDINLERCDVTLTIENKNYRHIEFPEARIFEINFSIFGTDDTFSIQFYDCHFFSDLYHYADRFYFEQLKHKKQRFALAVENFDGSFIKIHNCSREIKALAEDLHVRMVGSRIEIVMCLQSSCLAFCTKPVKVYTNNYFHPNTEIKCQIEIGMTASEILDIVKESTKIQEPLNVYLSQMNLELIFFKDSDVIDQFADCDEFSSEIRVAPQKRLYSGLFVDGLAARGEIPEARFIFCYDVAVFTSLEDLSAAFSKLLAQESRVEFWDSDDNQIYGIPASLVSEYEGGKFVLFLNTIPNK